jgi:urea transporter/murein DD-endopeptidase MepM/ murein hydrolase activator NlpD
VLKADLKPSRIIAPLKDGLLAVLNSYGMLFFSRNKLLSLLVLAVSFFTPFTGFCGLTALLVSITAAFALGFGKEQVRQGLLTYSVILFGLCMGANFEPGAAFFILLFVGALLTLFLSIALNAVLNKKGLPALSLAFIISSGIVMVAARGFEGIGLTYRHIYWFNEAYALGGNTLLNMLQQIEEWKIPDFVAGFFRSMSAIIFQVNMAAGILLSIGLLLYSRIAFVLMVLGYATAIFFNFAMGGFHQTDMTYYNMGTNFMLVAVALGGFYIIPSLRSFLWTLVTVPIAYLLVVALGGIAYRAGFPVFSLPFCLVVILFLFTLQLRWRPGKLVLTPIQYYSPEQNLYRFLNGKERIYNQYYTHLYLPFMGEWMVSQGHNGSMTHKGEWSHALDFVLLDHEMKTYAEPGNLPEHFYCYNKPVLAPADGIVQEAVDHIDDNAIGKNNTAQNWGNTVVIKHAEGSYTKISHLRKNSIRAGRGAYVKRGEIIGYCGNSGRSPEPHLHMQVQSTPYIGSKTINHPLACFIQRRGNETELRQFAVPEEGCFVSNVIPDGQLQEAFAFQPGYCLQVRAEGFPDEEWESMISIYNEPYLYCRQHEAFAYFRNNGTLFYLTGYEGPKNTLLHHFYCCAYKILLGSQQPVTVQDTFPVHAFGNNPLSWLQDIIAPFYVFIRMEYESRVVSAGDLLNSSSIRCTGARRKRLFGRAKEIDSFELEIAGGQIRSFSIFNHKKITAQCVVAN